MKRSAFTLAAALALSMVTAPARADEAANPGKPVFDRYCAGCHAPGFGHPGTQQLGWTRGAKDAVLGQRTDLSPDYVKQVVRHGLVEMPPFRPTEIDDARLEALAGYLGKAK
jgi:mono/diheme cytochrome c family protein